MPNAPKFRTLSRLSSSTPSPPLSLRTRWFTILGVVGLLVLHAWLALTAVATKSNAVDEMPHLTAGHAMWAIGDYRLQPENGNLPQRWEGLPAWLERRKLPAPDHPGWIQPNVWSLGIAYFYESGNDLAALLRAGRAMNLGWSLATGLLIFAWTRRLFGAAGAWLSLSFWVFCPTFLAHGALATSDACMAFLMLASMGAYWRHLHDFRWATAILSAVLLALAFVAKYSAVLLPPMFVVLAAIRLFDEKPVCCGVYQYSTRSSRLAALSVSAIVHLIVVIAVIWLFHGFRFAPTPNPAEVQGYTRPWSAVLDSLGGLRAAGFSGARQLHLLPDAYLYGFAFVLDLSDMRGAFLNGATSYTGWVQFFPYAFFVKTPVGLLLAGCVAFGLAIHRWWRRRDVLPADLHRFAPLMVLFVGYWAVSLSSHLNIGQRHLLPTYPIWFIGIGAIGWASARHRGWLLAGAILLGAHATASLRVRPHYLAFFNALAGGPAQGYRHLVDSSLDWGQDLPALKAWLDANTRPADRIYFAYFGNGDPSYYGIRATTMVPLLRIPPSHPAHALQGGIYCISATMLSQAYSPIREPWSIALERQYQSLRQTEPALLDYANHPAHRPELEKEIPAAQWAKMWERYEQLRFTRLCWFLRARHPDAQAGYSINIYRLSDADMEAATGASFDAWKSGIERALHASTP